MPTDDHDDDNQLSAYLDGVAELAPAERKRVEQRLAAEPALRAEAVELRAILDRARALPTPGASSEPDFARLERQIREAVGPAVPLPWWRRARWLAPACAIATTAALALVWLHHTPVEPTPVARDAAPVTASQLPAPNAAPESPPAPTTMYIDGQVIDIENVDPEVMMGDGDADATADQIELRLVPAADYHWLDALDDQSLERAEQWLAKKKG